MTVTFGTISSRVLQRSGLNSMSDTWLSSAASILLRFDPTFPPPTTTTNMSTSSWRHHPVELVHRRGQHGDLQDVPVAELLPARRDEGAPTPHDGDRQDLTLSGEVRDRATHDAVRDRRLDELDFAVTERDVAHHV